jgi:DNA polymerase III sliding clamp (beta) subunit (PCNA family)
MDVEQDGESLKFQANCRYLLDIFEAMPDCSRVEFNLRNAQTACLIKFPHNKSSSFLVMLLKDR